MAWWLWLASDLLFLAAFTLLLVPPIFATAYLFASLPLVLMPALILLFPTLLLISAFILRLCLPRLRPGSYAIPTAGHTFVWTLHFTVQRIVQLPLWYPLFMSLATLRWLMLRGLGARVHFDFTASTDAAVLDASLVTLGRGVMLGGGSLITGHYVEHGLLHLAPVVIGDGTQLGGSVLISPGVTVGKATMLGPGTKLLPHVTIGNETHLGLGCIVYNGARIGDNVVIGHEARIGNDTVIGDGAVVRSGCTVPKGARVGPNETFKAGGER